MAAPSIALDQIHQFLSVPVESLPIGIALPYAIYLKLSEKFVLLRDHGDVLTSERVAQLSEKKVDCAYIHGDDWRAFMNGLEKNLDEVGLLAGSEEAANNVRNVLFSYWRMIEEAGDLKPALFVKLKENAARIPIAIQANRDLAYSLLRRYHDPALYFANHSINIAVYSVAVGMKQRLGIEDLQELALAACVANIGIIKIPREVLYKPSGLEPNEWDMVKQHPQTGANLLRLLLVPPKVVQGALEHHESIDGKGYPFGRKEKEISLYARIIAIGEAFSALTSPRPWGPAFSPVKAVEYMQSVSGRFDPRLLKSSISGG